MRVAWLTDIHLNVVAPAELKRVFNLHSPAR